VDVVEFLLAENKNSLEWDRDVVLFLYYYTLRKHDLLLKTKTIIIMMVCITLFLPYSVPGVCTETVVQ